MNNNYYFFTLLAFIIPLSVTAESADGSHNALVRWFPTTTGEELSLSEFLALDFNDSTYFTSTDLSKTLTKNQCCGHSAFGSIILSHDPDIFNGDKMEIVKLVLKKYKIEDVMFYDKTGNLPIHYIHHKDMFDILIQYVPDLCFLENKRGETLGHIIRDLLSCIPYEVDNKDSTKVIEKLKTVLTKIESITGHSFEHSTPKKQPLILESYCNLEPLSFQ